MNTIKSQRLSSRLYLLAGCLLPAFGVMLHGDPVFMVWSSWVTNFVPLLFLALAAALVLSSGNVDIATGPLMSLLGMMLVFAVGLFPASTLMVSALHLVVLGIGLLIYLGISLLVKRGASSLIVTLAVLFVAKGCSTLLQTCLQGVGVVCRYFSAGSAVDSSGVLPARYVVHALATLWVAAAIAILAVGGAHCFRFYSRAGLEHVAVGSDRQSAKFAGVSVFRVHRTAFLYAGLLVALAMIIQLHGQANGGWSANTGWGNELLAIAVAVIGGTSVAGGRLDPMAVALSSFMVYAIRDVVANDLGLPSEMASIAFGLIIGTVVWADANGRRGTERE